MKFKLRIIISSFCISFVLLIVLTIYVSDQFVSYNLSSAKAEKANNALARLNMMESLLREMDVYENELINDHDSTNAANFYRAIKELNIAIDDLRKVVSTDAQTHIIVLFKSNVALRKTAYKERLHRIAGGLNVETDNNTIALKNESEIYVTKLQKNEREVLSANLDLKTESQSHASYSLVYLILILFGGTLVFFVLMIHQFKKRLAYHTELQANLVDLTTTNLELEQLAYASSHHLKEPLRKIKIFTDMLMLAETADADQVKKTAHKIMNATENLQRLVSGMEHLVTLERREQDDEINLDQFMNQFCEIHAQSLNNAGAKLHHGTLPVIQANKEQITLLFDSLLDNALKFRRPDVPLVIAVNAEMVSGLELAGKLQVSSSGLKNRTFFKITFSDNGQGFDQNYNLKIFDIFQKLSPNDASDNGIGLGLSIARRIMTNHKGFITAKGTVNYGAVFCLYFPTT